MGFDRHYGRRFWQRARDGGWLGVLAGVIHGRRRRRQSRIADLSDAALKDIGVNRNELPPGPASSFWDPG